MSRLAIEGGEKTVTLEPPTWPRLHVKEIEAAIDALRIAASGVDDSWEYLCSARGGGPTAEFERKFAQFMGAKYAMATNSGGAALHIAVMASGVEAGDEVIVSPYTWGQSVSCVLQQCAIPVFADIDPKTYTLDPASIEAKITPRTKAIVVVHIYGHPADMDGIMDVARRYGLKVIEDCAQATGAIYKGRRVGTIGDFGCFSIGNGKQIIGGEGGVLLTNDERLYELANVFGQHPMRQQHVVQDDELRRLMDSLIFTYRIHPLAAIIAGVQLNYLDEWNEQRRRNHELLSDGLGDMPGIEPVYTAPECTHVYHIYSPTFIPEEVEGISRDTYIKALQAEGVPISHGYVRMPIHLRPRMREKKYFFGRGYPWAVTPEGQALEYKPGDCPVAEERCANRELVISGGARWLGDQSQLVRQILDAFAKVAENLDVLRRIERESST